MHYNTYVALKIQRSAPHYLEAAFDEVEILDEASSYWMKPEWLDSLKVYYKNHPEKLKNVTGNDDLADILRQGLPTLLQKGNSSMSKDDTERIVDLCIRLSKPIRNHPSSLRSKPLPPPNRESVLSTSFRLLTPTTN